MDGADIGAGVGTGGGEEGVASAPPRGGSGGRRTCHRRGGSGGGGGGGGYLRHAHLQQVGTQDVFDDGAAASGSGAATEVVLPWRCGGGGCDWRGGGVAPRSATIPLANAARVRSSRAAPPAALRWPHQPPLPAADERGAGEELPQGVGQLQQQLIIGGRAVCAGGGTATSTTRGGSGRAAAAAGPTGSGGGGDAKRAVAGADGSHRGRHGGVAARTAPAAGGARKPRGAE